MSVFCVIYSLCCIATRIYEEYDYQRKLHITQAKIELALYSKENAAQMQIDFKRLSEISKIIAKSGGTDELLMEQTTLAANIIEKIQQFTEKRAHLQSLMTLSTPEAILVGMKNGLAAYGALTSVMFAIATVITLASSTFPPAFLIACISVGLMLLIGFIAHSVIHNYRHCKKQEENEEVFKPYDGLWNMLRILKEVKTAPPPTEELEIDVKTVIGDGMVIDASPQFFFQEWFEVVRSFFSGLGKGTKTVDFTMNPLQEAGDDGHYHETPIMLGLSVITSLVYASALSLRSHARAFGRPAIDKVGASNSDLDEFDVEMDVLYSDEFEDVDEDPVDDKQDELKKNLVANEASVTSESICVSVNKVAINPLEKQNNDTKENQKTTTSCIKVDPKQLSSEESNSVNERRPGAGPSSCRTLSNLSFFNRAQSFTELPHHVNANPLEFSASQTFCGVF